MRMPTISTSDTGRIRCYKQSVSHSGKKSKNILSKTCWKSVTERGLTWCHFAVTHPEVTVYGIDISGEMRRIATNRVKKKELERVVAAEGSVEDLERLFPGKRFDIIYVFFGALNTVSNLDETARILKKNTK